MYKIAIDKAQVNEMPVVSYDGHIVMVDTLSRVKSAVEALRRQPIVGFDTETRPSFKRGVLHKTALLQFATTDTCFLFRINKIGLPDLLKAYMEDGSKLKVGLSLHDDWGVLHRQHDVSPAGFIDVQDLAPRYHIADISLQKMYAILFGKKITKNQRLTNWEADELTESQQRYAAIDAWACINIYHRLTDGSFNPEISPYRHDITEEEI